MAVRLGDVAAPDLADLAAHLDTCVDCRRSARARLRPAPDVVPLRPVSVPAPTYPRTTGPAADRPRVARRWRPLTLLRGAMIVLAVLQLVLAAPDLLGALGFVRVARAAGELGILDTAVAGGFLVAGVRPRLAGAYLPVAAALCAGLGLTSGLDIAHGVVTAVHELRHLVTLGQAGLLWVMRRTWLRRNGERTALAGQPQRRNGR